MLDYSLLKITPELKITLEEYGFTTDRDLLYYLEQYKYYTNKDLTEFVKSFGNDDVRCCDYEEDYSDRAYPTVELRYDVVVKESSEDVEVLYDCTSDINKISVEMDLNCLKPITYKSLTPYSFCKIQGKSMKPLEPMDVFRRLMIEAVNRKATDVHFDVAHYRDGVEYPVSFRIDNKLERVSLFDITKELNKSMIGSLIEKKTSTNAIDLLDAGGVETSASGIVGDDITLRITANSVSGGYHYVIRMQKPSTVSFRINQLGFQKEVEDALTSVSELRSGITFITGAVRTGKNTTGFALVNEMIDKELKIVSYESPIEVWMPFSQVDYQGNADILLNSVRLAKKQDVNIAYINELPNKDVAFAVQDLANSSIHVITTTHVDRVWHLPYKLREYYGDDYKDVISQINAVFNQKMYVKMCPHCQERILVDSIENVKITEFLKNRGTEIVPVSTGCKFCNHTGIVVGGNRPYAEFVIFTNDIKRKLLRCESPAAMEEVLREAVKGKALEDYVYDAVVRGEVSYTSLSLLME
jgi:type II secretory ATPase GspE/PulE/Tfp pilus assembly ATPase PilB-like protein